MRAYMRGKMVVISLPRATMVVITLHVVAAHCEGVGESALLGCGGDFERVAAAGDAVLDASGNELLVRDGSGLAVDGDGSGEREAGNGGAHGIMLVQIVRHVALDDAVFSGGFPVSE